MKLGLIVASLLVGGSALAQAPGAEVGAEVVIEGDIAPPSMTPVAPVAPPPAPPPPRERRWSVGLGFGSLGLAPHGQPENETEFSLGMIAVRYRPWRHLELELAFSGGREQLEDDYEGDREVSQAVLAARWRFSPLKKWNAFLMFGMGGLTVANHYASDEERESLSQSTLQFGAGIERRWRRFALQLELRAVGVAPIEDEDRTVMADVKPEPGNNTTTMDPLPPVYPSNTGHGWSGGQLLFSGNYYF